MLKNLLISLNHKEELHFQNQYSEFTNNSSGKDSIAELSSHKKSWEQMPYIQAAAWDKFQL